MFLSQTSYKFSFSICCLLCWTGLNWLVYWLFRQSNLQPTQLLLWPARNKSNKQLRGYCPNLYCALKEIFRPFLQVIDCRESISAFIRSISISAFCLVSPVIQILNTQWSRLCKCSQIFWNRLFCIYIVLSTYCQNLR